MAKLQRQFELLTCSHDGDEQVGAFRARAIELSRHGHFYYACDFKGAVRIIAVCHSMLACRFRGFTARHGRALILAIYASDLATHHRTRRSMYISPLAVASWFAAGLALAANSCASAFF